MSTCRTRTLTLSGANPLGRWDYGPWFWPVFPVAVPYPPTVSHVPEAFMDTPMVNGTAYPYLNVQPHLPVADPECLQ